jgi:outer membrane protein TolC
MGVPLGWASPAQALQPLQQFIDEARQRNVSLNESEANLQAAQAQADVALGRQLPGVSVRGTYTFNQYEASIPGSLFGVPDDIVITPQNALDAYGVVNVPLVDLASFQRIASAKTGAEAASHQLENVKLLVDTQVVQNYYQVVAAIAVVGSAQRQLDVAKAFAQTTRVRVEAGRAPSLDGDRADAEVERQVQVLAAAQLQVAITSQALFTASGLQPDVAGAAPLEDDLHAEPPLDQFKPVEGGTPAQQAAAANTRASQQQAQAAKLALVPTLSGSFTEHASNYAGFSGHDASFQAVAALNWQLDYTTFANMRLASANATASEQREIGVSLQTRDAIHNAWEAVQSALARSRSARVQAKVTSHAQDMARDRYLAGAATQLDVTTAERDAFSADVARIQADADLVNARLQLRLATGRSPFAASGATP